MRAAEFASLLVRQGESNRYRHTILLTGANDWLQRTIAEILDDRRAVLISDRLWSLENTRIEFVSPSSVDQLLGTEVDNLVLDASEGYDATSIGITTGCVRAGGLCIIASPNLHKQSLSGFDLHCDSILRQSKLCYQITEGKDLYAPHTMEHRRPPESVDISNQQQAIDGICHVVHGQRKRPAVLVADRGRGKSAALGIAASKLFENGITQIIVTGRSRRSAAKVFEHCKHHNLSWCSADQLISDNRPCELLLIDEAASLPFSLLKQLLKQYPRVAMATTVHGYEGTGQGFMLRFTPVLDNTTRGWRRINLATPIRWNAGDPLESLTNRLLVQDSELSVVKADTVAVQECGFEELTRSDLLKNEQLLREIYSLLSLAHYQTRPSDLSQLLEHSRMKIFRVTHNHASVGVVLAVIEGNLSTQISQQVFAGKRRPEGHALPEILASQLGQPTAATLKYARIMRIVIHPQLQRRGLGRHLLSQVSATLSPEIDLIGSHFAATPGLVEFWRKQGFSPVRIGQSRSVKTGGHSVVVLKTASDRSNNAVQQARQDFGLNFPAQLLRGLSDIDPEIVLALMRGNTAFECVPDAAVLQQIAGYCHSQRNAETLSGALVQMAIYGLFLGEFNHPYLWVERIMLGKEWADCRDCAGHDGWKSGNRLLRADALEIMRNHFTRELSQFNLESSYREADCTLESD